MQAILSETAEQNFLTLDTKSMVFVLVWLMFVVEIV